MSEKAATYANKFRSVFKAAAVTTLAEKEKIEAELGKVETAIEELQDKRKSLEEQLAEIGTDVALALQIAAKEEGVSLDLAGGNGRKEGSGKRIPRAEMGEAAAKILKVLPPKGKTFKSVDAIVISVNLDSVIAKSALQKLKRDNEAKTNGKRGTASGWQRV